MATRRLINTDAYAGAHRSNWFNDRRLTDWLTALSCGCSVNSERAVEWEFEEFKLASTINPAEVRVWFLSSDFGNGDDRRQCLSWTARSSAWFNSVSLRVRLLQWPTRTRSLLLDQITQGIKPRSLYFFLVLPAIGPLATRDESASSIRAWRRIVGVTKRELKDVRNHVQKKKTLEYTLQILVLWSGNYNRLFISYVLIFVRIQYEGYRS